MTIFRLKYHRFPVLSSNVPFPVSCAMPRPTIGRALLLVSDNPMVPEGVKTKDSDDHVTKNYASFHVEMGVKSLQKIIYGSNTLKHLKIDL